MHIFSYQFFSGVNRLFVLIYLNRDSDVKRFKTRRYYLPKGLIKNYNVIISGKNYYDSANDSDKKGCEEIKKLTTGEGAVYTTACLLDYNYIKNNSKLIAVDLSRKNELDADIKTIQQIKFVEQLDMVDGINADRIQSMFILTILENIKDTRLNIPQSSVTVL